MDSVVVTGGAGFIGSNLIRSLLHQSNRPLWNVDKLTYAGSLESLSGLNPRGPYEFVHGDIGDRKLISNLLTQARPSTIIHLAAESHVDRAIDGPLPFVMTNVVGTCNLLEETLNYWQSLEAPQRSRFRFVHVSTDEVFGDLGPVGKFHEQTAYDPHSPYSASKAASDHFVRAYYHTYGLPVIVTHCSNNYGPRQFPEKLIPLMILRAVAGKSLPIYGDGSHVRDWLHVADHCNALQVVAERGVPGETYLIGGQCEKSNLEVVRDLCAAVKELHPDLGHEPHQLISYEVDRPGHDRRYAVSTEKIRSELGWSPRVSFQSGILETVKWYLENSEWIQEVTRGECHGHRRGLDRI
ncbi:MAG: dTDP-glucose 4,6-dehydratase [Mariniblastus sp.]|nr:dTDP-glucose 4,6-dehydratase [Mariniblastus sp.]